MSHVFCWEIFLVINEKKILFKMKLPKEFTSQCHFEYRKLLFWKELYSWYFAHFYILNLHSYLYLRSSWDAFLFSSSAPWKFNKLLLIFFLGRADTEFRPWLNISSHYLAEDFHFTLTIFFLLLRWMREMVAFEIDFF